MTSSYNCESLIMNDDSRGISIVSAADDKYAMPLGVTIRSAIDHLGSEQAVNIYILDGGLSRQSKARLGRSWRDPRTTITWLSPDLNQVNDFRTESHLNHVTYLRLLMAELLPSQLNRVIYLDADLLVLRSIRDMWDLELIGAPVAAVYDSFTPYLNTRETIGRPTACDRDQSTSLPIPNYRELGLAGESLYFNAGVMVVNLAAWREQRVFKSSGDLLRKHAEHARFCDQYALNILFSQRWKSLDPRWNQNSILCHISEANCPLPPAGLRLVRDDPWIVHFSWIEKPWHYGCKHPYVDQFFEVVDRTDWRGWRPAAPRRTLREIYSDYYSRYQRWYGRTFGRQVPKGKRRKRKAA